MLPLASSVKGESSLHALRRSEAEIRSVIALSVCDVGFIKLRMHALTDAEERQHPMSVFKRSQPLVEALGDELP
jgi:hypothetical protein